MRTREDGSQKILTTGRVPIRKNDVTFVIFKSHHVVLVNKTYHTEDARQCLCARAVV